MADEQITLDWLGRHMLALTARVNDLEARFTGLETRMTGLEARFSALEARFTGFDVRLDAIERRFAVLDDRQSRMLSLLVRMAERMGVGNE